jgi:hypothetical protein
MASYLITGIAGSGKSSVAQVLISNGYHAVDADASYSHWLDLKTGESYASRPRKTKDWANYFEWVWQESKILEVIGNQQHKALFICGMSGNQANFYRLFDKIFLLKADPATISYRLKARVNNPFGKRPGDIETALSLQSAFDLRAINAGAISIPSTQPVAKVIDEILRHVTDA